MLRFESDSSLCSIASTERLKSLDVFVTNDTVPENPRNVQISVPSGVRPLLGRECDTLYIMTFFIRRSVQPVRHSMHTSVLFDVDPLLDQPPPFPSLSLLSGSLRTSYLLDVCLMLHCLLLHLINPL